MSLLFSVSRGCVRERLESCDGDGDGDGDSLSDLRERVTKSSDVLIEVGELADVPEVAEKPPLNPSLLFLLNFLLLLLSIERRRFSDFFLIAVLVGVAAFVITK